MVSYHAAKNSGMSWKLRPYACTNKTIFIFSGYTYRLFRSSFNGKSNQFIDDVGWRNVSEWRFYNKICGRGSCINKCYRLILCRHSIANARSLSSLKVCGDYLFPVGVQASGSSCKRNSEPIDDPYFSLYVLQMLTDQTSGVVPKTCCRRCAHCRNVIFKECPWEVWKPFNLYLCLGLVQTLAGQLAERCLKICL